MSGCVSVVPNFLAGDCHRYDAHFDFELGYFVERTTRKLITFDFDKDYAEPLVHHGSGRVNGASVAALSRLRLHDNLSDELIRRLKSICTNYVSIHIRNTDYTTNYQPLLNQIKNSLLCRTAKLCLLRLMVLLVCSFAEKCFGR